MHLFVLSIVVTVVTPSSLTIVIAAPQLAIIVTVVGVVTTFFVPFASPLSSSLSSWSQPCSSLSQSLWIGDRPSSPSRCRRSCVGAAEWWCTTMINQRERTVSCVSTLRNSMESIAAIVVIVVVVVVNVRKVHCLYNSVRSDHEHIAVRRASMWKIYAVESMYTSCT